VGVTCGRFTPGERGPGIHLIGGGTFPLSVLDVWRSQKPLAAAAVIPVLQTAA
jgi:hypothetical protein